MPRRRVSGGRRRGISARRSAFKSTSVRPKKRTARSRSTRRSSRGMISVKRVRSSSRRAGESSMWWDVAKDAVGTGAGLLLGPLAGYATKVGLKIADDLGSSLAHGAQNYTDKYIGPAVNALAAKVRGHGDYSVSLGGHGGAIAHSSVPTFSSGGSPGNVVVKKAEYLGDVIVQGGSAGVAATFQTLYQLPLNPGLLSTFPWLSSLAQNFEEYEFSGLMFEFRSNSADALNSTNTALGQVMMATQYNVLNPPFSSKQQMLEYEGATSSRPSNSFLHGVECAKHATVLPEQYVRTGPPPAGSDLRMYDIGTFSLCTQGLQDAPSNANINLGELWVTYSVNLRKPKLLTGSFTPSGARGAMSQILNVAMPTSGATYWDNSTYYNTSNTLNVYTYAGTNTSTITFGDAVPQNAVINIMVYCYNPGGNDATVTAPTPSTFVGCAQMTTAFPLSGLPPSNTAPDTSVADLDYTMCSFFVRVTGAPGTARSLVIGGKAPNVTGTYSGTLVGLLAIACDGYAPTYQGFYSASIQPPNLPI